MSQPHFFPRDEYFMRLALREAERAFEHEDAKSLHRLQKELRPLRNTTLFSLLVELMELDTKKHIVILEFIRRRATESWRQGG